MMEVKREDAMLRHFSERGKSPIGSLRLPGGPSSDSSRTMKASVRITIQACAPLEYIHVGIGNVVRSTRKRQSPCARR